MGMTREQFGTLVKAMKAVYTQPSFIPDQDAFDVWYEMLKDLDYKVASYAVKKHMLVSEDVPKVASIRKQAVNITSPEEMSEMAAWNMVYKAICNSIHHEDEEFNKLPEVVRQAVGSSGQLHEWAQMDTAVVNSVIQSNFMRTFRNVQSRSKEKAILSPDILKIIHQKVETKKIEG